MRDNIVNDIVLTVINDGNGDQCGLTYKQRCNAAQYGLASYRIACVRYGNSIGASKQQVLEAADEVQEYYREHTKEMA